MLLRNGIWNAMGCGIDGNNRTHIKSVRPELELSSAEEIAGPGSIPGA